MSKPSLQRRFLPSHAILRSFECAARQESFTKAAEELHLTQSAVSRQVKELEALIGTDLFRRVGRRVVLTDAGKNFARELAIDLENVRQTVLRAIAAGDRGASLRIAVLPTFASRWLIPRLSDFTDRHPHVTINLATRLKPFDMGRERFDIAIHFGTDDWPETKMVRIFDEEMIPVCAPDFQTRHKIAHMEQLAHLPLLHLETRPTAWLDWFRKTGLGNKQAYSGQQFDQFSMLIAAALASLGVALLPKYLIENELKSGSLVRIGNQNLRTKNSYFIVTNAGHHPPVVENFSRWIQNAAKGNSLEESG